MEGKRLTLDNPIFVGRLRQPRRSPAYVRRPTPQPARIIQDVSLKPNSVKTHAVGVPAFVPVKNFHRVALVSLQQPIPHTAAAVKPLRLVLPAEQLTRRQPQKSAVLTRQQQAVPHTEKSKWKRLAVRKQTAVLYAMAVAVFVVGVAVSLNGLRANRQVAAQVSQLQKSTSSNEPATSTGHNNPTAPSTTPISAQTIANYMVAPDLARYLKIPKLKVDARVLQVGVTTTGALATPNNVFDTAWYTGSAKPGEPGATLIDGHVSSWTSHGVFYGLKQLVAGDTIQIQRGDGTILTYKVVKSQVYPANKVDMQAAMTPVVPGKSGLNLITCTGDVEAGTSEFNERIIVFATLVS